MRRVVEVPGHAYLACCVQPQEAQQKALRRSNEASPDTGLHGIAVRLDSVESLGLHTKPPLLYVNTEPYIIFVNWC